MELSNKPDLPRTKFCPEPFKMISASLNNAPEHAYIINWMLKGRDCRAGSEHPASKKCRPGFGLIINNFEESRRLWWFFWRSIMATSDFDDKPTKMGFIAIQYAQLRNAGSNFIQSLNYSAWH